MGPAVNQQPTGPGTATASGTCPAPAAAIAPVLVLPTVEQVPATSSLHHAARTDLTRRSLGKIGRLDPAGITGGPALRLVDAAAPAGRLRFPCGARTRKLDSSGRVKLTGDDRLSQVLGWRDGGVEVTAEDGWLVLRQPSHVSGLEPTRFSRLATLTGVGGAAERIVLKPSHLELVGLPEDRHLLVAAIPGPSTTDAATTDAATTGAVTSDGGVLVLVDPAAVLAGAPIAVACALHTVHPEPTR